MEYMGAINMYKHISKEVTNLLGSFVVFAILIYATFILALMLIHNYTMG